jgi:hypothetical protein
MGENFRENTLAYFVPPSVKKFKKVFFYKTDTWYLQTRAKTHREPEEKVTKLFRAVNYDQL